MPRRAPISPITKKTHVIVADGPAHARAVMAWWRLDPRLWTQIYWGERCKGEFKHAFIALPTDGVSELHLDWLRVMLRPCVSGGFSVSHKSLLRLIERRLSCESEQASDGTAAE